MEGNRRAYLLWPNSHNTAWNLRGQAEMLSFLFVQRPPGRLSEFSWNSMIPAPVRYLFFILVAAPIFTDSFIIISLDSFLEWAFYQKKKKKMLF